MPKKLINNLVKRLFKQKRFKVFPVELRVAVGFPKMSERLH